MGYCINYKIEYKSKNIISERKNQCFSSFYRHIDTIKNISIYVLKDFSQYDGNSMQFSKEEIERYVFLLEKMGFLTTLSECKILMSNYDSKEEFSLEQEGQECYKFYIDVEKNNPFKVLVLLNAIRNLHEDDFPLIVRKFLEITEKHDLGKPVDVWNLFLISNYQKTCKSWINSNHHIFWGRGSAMFFTDKEFEDIISNNKECKNVSEKIKLKQISPEDFSEITNSDLKKYKQICSKYE